MPPGAWAETAGNTDGSSPSQSNERKTDASAGSWSSTQPTPRSRTSRAVMSRLPAASRVLDVGWPRRADAAQPDLHDARHVVHLRRAAHRRRVALPDPVHLVTEVEVRVDLEDGERTAAVIRAQDRDRHRVVATDAHRHRPALEDRRHGRGGGGRVAGSVGRVAGHVAGIHDSRPPVERQHRGVEVEVPMSAEAGETLRAATDRRWSRPRSPRRSPASGTAIRAGLRGSRRRRRSASGSVSTGAPRKPWLGAFSCTPRRLAALSRARPQHSGGRGRRA